MGVDIHESRGERVAGKIDRLDGVPGIERADGRDQSVPDRDISAIPGTAVAVKDRCVLQ